MESKSLHQCGLRNRGNTCFMNTFLQCLMSICELNDYFTSNEYVKDLSSRTKHAMRKGENITVKSTLTREYGSMINFLSEHRVSIFDPKGFHESFQKLNHIFHGYNQHDSTEALTLVLDAFHESLKYGLRLWYSGNIENPTDRLITRYVDSIKEQAAKDYSIIYKLFNAHIIQTLICKESDRDGEELSMRVDPYMMTLLEIPSGATELYECFDEFFCDESLDDDNLYYDEKSKTRVKTDIRKQFIHLPEYLIIALKRFIPMGGGYRKNKARIGLPYGNDLLDVGDYTVGYEKNQALYDLHAIGLHSGDMNGGHYYAYCKKEGSETFLELNDSHISQIDLKEREHDIFTQGYLFIYKKYPHPVAE